MIRIIKWTIPRRNLALTSILNVRRRGSDTTVHQRAEALKYIDELAKTRVGKFTQTDKANAISDHFDFTISRPGLQKWIKNRDVIFANAESFEPPSEFAPNQPKRALSFEQINFEIELCSILYSELDRRNLSMGFVKEQARLLANDKYPTLIPYGSNLSGQHDNFNEHYCYAMLLRNGWKWPNMWLEKMHQTTHDRKGKLRSRKFAIPQRRYIGYVQNGRIVGHEPMSMPGEQDHVPFLINKDDMVMIPAMNVAQFKDGEKVSFFVAVSNDEQTKDMKVARRIEAVSDN